MNWVEILGKVMAKRLPYRMTISAMVISTAFTLMAATMSQADQGSALFGRHCAICHQKNGRGSHGRVPALVGEFQDRLHKLREYLPLVVLNGLSGTIVVGDTIYDGVMPSFSSRLDDDAISAILNHVQFLQGQPHLPRYSPDEVRAFRNYPMESDALRRLRE